MEGIMFLLNETGIALAQLRAEVARLEKENADLRALVIPPEPQPE